MNYLANLLLVFQIAAKIGGDAGPPVNNSTAPDSFPFTAQKRQLEDTNTGDCTFISLCDYFSSRESPMNIHFISSSDRWARDQEAGCSEWLGVSQSAVWVHLTVACIVICDLQSTVGVCVLHISPLVILNLSPALFSHSAIGAQLAALAQQRWDLVPLRWLCINLTLLLSDLLLFFPHLCIPPVIMASDPPPPQRSTVFQTVWWDSVSVAQLYFNTYCIPHFFLNPTFSLQLLAVAVNRSIRYSKSRVARFR